MTGKFIVIEGLDATGKSTFASRLAESLKATLLKCPPQLKAPELSDKDLRDYFDDRPSQQCRAYYRAANLIASELAEEALMKGHVVMDRYWTSTVAFASLDDDLNLNQEWRGRYPLELQKPDVVILLTVDEENRLKRMHERGESVTTEEQVLAENIAGRESVLQTYRTFKPIEINTSHLDPDGVLEIVLKELLRYGVLENNDT